MFRQKQTTALAKRAFPKIGVGQIGGNPKRCLYCRKPICQGEAWNKQTSPDGVYGVIIHEMCSDKDEHRHMKSAG